MIVDRTIVRTELEDCTNLALCSLIEYLNIDARKTMILRVDGGRDYE
jgi:hypothetical protein